MHWSIDSLAEAGTVASVKKMKALVKGMNIRGVMAVLILIGLILVSVQSAFLLHDVRQLGERANRLEERLGPIQEKSLELYIEPWYRVPAFLYEERGEIEV